jgi:predicted Fe-Mo cluster-binding NifX family protein
MKVCFAVGEYEGIDSFVYGHFGSAPAFVVVDTEDGTVSRINNGDLGHAHGACNPIMALNGSDVDAVVVGGIGAGALRGLNGRGIRVFAAVEPTVRGNLDLLKTKRLPEMTLQQTCGGHGGGGGCAHH